MAGYRAGGDGDRACYILYRLNLSFLFATKLYICNASFFKENGTDILSVQFQVSWIDNDHENLLHTL